jgi:voltage-gated potassium channel
VRALDLRRSLRRLAVYLGMVFLLHIVAMVILEGLSPFEATWLTLTTATTVGYGDLSAESVPGRVATVLLIYFGGIFVVFQAATAYFELRSDRRLRMYYGRWSWNMRDHIVLLNTPAENPEHYVERLVSEFRSSHRYGELPVLIVTTRFANGLPDALQKLGAVHVTGSAADPHSLVEAGVAEAAIVVVLARRDSDAASDGRTFDILHRLTELGAKGKILAECVDDANRKRLRRAGAHILVRPMRGYPEMIVRALVAPGAEHILEDLFTSQRDECWRYDVRLDGARWGDLLCLLVEEDVGIPIAYRSAEDASMRMNPPPDTRVRADKLYVIVREGNNRTDGEVAALLSGLARA